MIKDMGDHKILLCDKCHQILSRSTKEDPDWGTGKAYHKDCSYIIELY